VDGWLWTLGKKMNQLFQIYTRACRRVVSRGRCWRSYVFDLLIVGGIPLALVFLLLGVLAFAGIPALESDGVLITGVEALMTSLIISLVGIPLLCVFVGSIAWLMHEVFKMP
jgi:hypothetical protein